MSFVHVGALNITDRDLSNLAKQAQTGIQTLTSSGSKQPEQKPQAQAQTPYLPEPMGLPGWVLPAAGVAAAAYYLMYMKK